LNAEVTAHTGRGDWGLGCSTSALKCALQQSKRRESHLSDLSPPKTFPPKTQIRGVIFRLDTFSERAASAMKLSLIAACVAVGAAADAPPANALTLDEIFLREHSSENQFVALLHGSSGRFDVSALPSQDEPLHRGKWFLWRFCCCCVVHLTFSTSPASTLGSRSGLEIPEWTPGLASSPRDMHRTTRVTV
jgi:hypothetical protein